MARGEHIYVERIMIKSKAFFALKSPTACKVLFMFLYKRQFMKVGSKKKKWMLINDGQIEFTYLEAESYGISPGAFRRAVDELMEKGFIDIAETGQGVHKVKNLYSISNRWRNYGTDDFRLPEKRKKGPINRGFQKGNQYGRNCKKNLTVTDNNGSTVANNNNISEQLKPMLPGKHSENEKKLPKIKGVNQL